jgi:dipeptidyl aminopeptidase/acylaminoacyl peptidase
LLGAAFVGAAAMVGIRNYRAIQTLFAAEPAADILNQPERTAVPQLQAVRFGAQSGATLAAWYVAPRQTRGPALVLATGTNADRSTLLPEIRLLASAGFGVLAFDWPGLGQSQGPVRWDGEARAALTSAIDWLSARAEVNPVRIGGLGFSIGGYIMTQVAAADTRLRAVVLEATPSDFQDYLLVHNSNWGWVSRGPARWALRGTGLLDEQMAPVNLIARISPRPVLLLAMSQDPEIPADLVQKLFAAAREPRTLWVVPGSRHGGYAELAPVEYPKRITEFFSESLAVTSDFAQNDARAP